MIVRRTPALVWLVVSLSLSLAACQADEPVARTELALVGERWYLDYTEVDEATGATHTYTAFLDFTAGYRYQATRIADTGTVEVLVDVPFTVDGDAVVVADPDTGETARFTHVGDY